MGHRRNTTLALVCIASLVMLAVSPLPITHAADTLGQHVVRAGETLYCIGRGYGVKPSAIASANGLSALARLTVGQVLTIPAVQWASIPAGPGLHAAVHVPLHECERSRGNPRADNSRHHRNPGEFEFHVHGA